MNADITITAIIEKEPTGSTRSAVQVRRGDCITVSAWLIGDYARTACVHVAADLARVYPDDVQTHVGFGGAS